jgi:hypothetical protein
MFKVEERLRAGHGETGASSRRSPHNALFPSKSKEAAKFLRHG